MKYLAVALVNLAVIAADVLDGAGLTPHDKGDGWSFTLTLVLIWSAWFVCREAKADRESKNA